MTQDNKRDIILATIKALAEEHNLRAAWYELKDNERYECKVIKNYFAKEYHRTRLLVNATIRNLALTDEERERLFAMAKVVYHHTILANEEFTEENYARMVGYVLA